MGQALRLRMSPSAPDEDGVKIYVTPDVADGLKAELEANGYETSWGLEAAFGVDDLIIVIASVAGAVGGLNGLANVLNAFFHKHQHRSITIKSGDEEVTLSGLSKHETKAALEDALDRVAQRQKALDESWHQILDETDSPDTVD